MSKEKSDIEKMYADYMEHMKALISELPLPDIAGEGDREVRKIRCGDGTGLSTWYYFPKDLEGPYPTVAVRCCYPQQEESLEYKAKAFNKKGFAFVIQWCRGIGESEGEWVPNVNERADGLSFMRALQEDTRIKNIGYWGDSYLALTGWCMADAVPSKVKTMYLGVYGCFRHTSAYKDGLFRQDILTDWAMANAGVEVRADYLESAKYHPQIEVDEKLWGIRLPWYRDWITHTDEDDAYWDEGFWGQLKGIPEKVKIPLYVKEGWYDHHLGSAIRTWEALPAKIRSHSIFEIGPWNHAYMPCIDHQSTENLRDESLESPLLWFDKILRKGQTPEGSVRLYRVGADRWDILSEFPSENADNTRLYLGREEGMALLAKCPVSEERAEFIYDPENPFYTRGAESTFHTMMENGSHLQPEYDGRSDVVTFVSAPISEEMHICGKICAKLWVSSDAEDTAFSIKISEIFEDGEAYNVRGTITTLAYRNGVPHRISYEAGKKVLIELKTWDIDWLFKQGSRIRLDISSSDFPQYSVHSNYPGVWSAQEKTKKAVQTIYFGGESDSCIILPKKRLP
ncbi:CocE/NonD family hydrolase [Butyrivibrio sp. JL13D10]|uniref:CocE/NonD family hydrolase n=1 Tax=Butyrivibrio sp. JL13D10 TaxID=3236815 RepID=UPI0038B52BF9